LDKFGITANAAVENCPMQAQRIFDFYTLFLCPSVLRANFFGTAPAILLNEDHFT
jgi:hypothetical protein